MARVINTEPRIAMEAEKCLRGRLGMVLKGPLGHGKELEVYTLGQCFISLATCGIT